MATENKKKGETKIGAVIILVISAVVFLPVGGAAVFQSLFNRSQLPEFGSYAGQKIEYEQGSKFANAVSNITSYYQQNGTFDQYRQYGAESFLYRQIFYESFVQTVQTLAFSKAVARSGYAVPQGAIDRALLPRFTDETGKYSPKMYNQTDEATLTQLRADAREMLTYSRYTNDVFGTSYKRDDTGMIGTFNGESLYGLKPNAREEAFIADMASRRHAFNLAAFSTDSLPEKEVARFAEDNAGMFIRYNLSAISADSEGEAKSLLKRVKSETLAFEDAVNESAQYYTNSDGKVTQSYSYQIEDKLENLGDLAKITGLAEGEYSGVIKTNTGWTFFKCDGPAVAADISDESLLGDVEAYIKSNERGYIEDYYSTLAQDFADEAAASDFRRACASYNVTLTEVPAFALNYGASSLYEGSSPVAELSGLAQNADAMEKVFALKAGAISAPIILGSNVIVLECTEISFVPSGEDGDSLAERISGIDSDSARNTLLSSDKVVNNVAAATNAVLN